jgi:hypothetical protein
VGSPLRLLLALGLISSVIAVSAVPGASASSSSSADDALVAARAFVDALANNDGQRACALFSPKALAAVGGAESCVRSMTQTNEDDADYATLDILQQAYTTARLSATKRKGQFVTKKFGARKLAHDMEQLDTDLTVKLGRSWTAAKGQLATTIVLDTRSTSRRLVLYAESDDGSIIRLSGSAIGHPSYDEVGTGIPETSEPSSAPSSASFTATIDSVTMDSTGTAFAHGTFTVTDEDDLTVHYGILLVLVPVNGSYYVDDLFCSTLASGVEDGG